jgi:hypothetical protein
VPQLSNLDPAALRDLTLLGDDLDLPETHPGPCHIVAVCTPKDRWLRTGPTSFPVDLRRAMSCPRYRRERGLWIPVKPGRPRAGRPPVKPGLTPAAVRTLHAAHRRLVSHVLGIPLRSGALRGNPIDTAGESPQTEGSRPAATCGASRPRRAIWPRCPAAARQ